ncbi:MAG TPA: MFS transporter, partial [Candidatus Binatus sp.]|nr:MFS transporter [Candidatus Binatus sp.]
AMTSAGILLVVGMPLAWLINYIYRRHGSVELRADQTVGHVSSASANADDPQYTLKEALRTKLFWLFSIAMAFRHLVTEGVSVHFVILLVDRGWSTEAASGLLGLSAVIGAPARLLMGWLGDILDKRRLAMGLLAALSLSVLLMGWSAEAFLFTTCMVIYSLAYGGLAALQEPIRADYFGTKAFATIQGVSRSVTTAGTFMGPILAGVFYDLTKSYTVAFAIFAVMSLVSMFFMFLAKPQPLSS